MSVGQFKKNTVAPSMLDATVKIFEQTTQYRLTTTATGTATAATIRLRVLRLTEA